MFLSLAVVVTPADLATGINGMNGHAVQIDQAVLDAQEAELLADTDTEGDEHFTSEDTPTSPGPNYILYGEIGVGVGLVLSAAAGYMCWRSKNAQMK